MSRTAASLRGTIQGAARQTHPTIRSDSVTVGTIANRREIMKVCKTRAIGVEVEHRAVARTSAFIRGALQGVARYNHPVIRISSVTVTGRGCRETVQRREHLRCHAASRNQAEDRNQHGQEE